MFLSHAFGGFVLSEYFRSVFLFTEQAALIFPFHFSSFSDMVAALLIISRHEWGSRAAHPTQGRVGVGGWLGISPCVCLPGRGGYFGLLYLCSPYAFNTLL